MKENILKNCIHTLDFVTKYWVVFAALGSMIVFLVGCCIYQTAPLYNLKEIGYQQQQENEKINFVNFHNDLGIKYLYIDQIDEARNEFNKVLKVDPLNPSANMHLVDCDLISQANNRTTDPSVLDIMSETIKKDDPDDPLTYLVCGDLYLSSHDLTNATKNYEKAISLDDANAAAYEGLGSVYDEQNDTENELVYFKKACNLTPNNFKYRNNLAHVYYERKDYPNAINEYTYTINLNPNFLLPYYYLSNSYGLNNELNNANSIQTELIKRLDDDSITNLPLNQEEWRFSTGSEDRLLNNLSQKKYYAYYDKALLCYLLGHEDLTKGYVNKSNDLHLDAGVYDVKIILDFDKNIFLTKQPEYVKQVTEFRKNYPAGIQTSKIS